MLGGRTVVGGRTDAEAGRNKVLDGREEKAGTATQSLGPQHSVAVEARLVPPEVGRN